MPLVQNRIYDFISERVWAISDVLLIILNLT